MYSQRQFTPGKKGNSSKMINYIAAYNALFPNSEQQTCSACIADKYDKFTIGSDSPSVRVSNNVRVAQIVKFSKGGFKCELFRQNGRYAWRKRYPTNQSILDQLHF